MSDNRRGVALGCLALVLIAAFFIGVPILIYKALPKREIPEKYTEDTEDFSRPSPMDQPLQEIEVEESKTPTDVPMDSYDYAVAQETYEEAYQNRVADLNNEAYQALMHDNDVARARTLIDPLFEDSPTAPGILHTNILVHIREGNYRKAERFFDLLTHKISPLDGFLIEVIEIAEYAQKHGQTNNAQLKPFLSKCYNYLMFYQSKVANNSLLNRWIQEEKYNEAYAFAMEGKPFTDYNSEHMRNLGDYFRDQEDFTRAIAAYESLCVVNDREPNSTLNSLGYSLYREGRTEEAIYYLEKAAALGNEAAQRSLDRIRK